MAFRNQNDVDYIFGLIGKRSRSAAIELPSRDAVVAGDFAARRRGLHF
jgi:hypothetical protein